MGYAITSQFCLFRHLDPVSLGRSHLAIEPNDMNGLTSSFLLLLKGDRRALGGNYVDKSEIRGNKWQWAHDEAIKSVVMRVNGSVGGDKEGKGANVRRTRVRRCLENEWKLKG